MPLRPTVYILTNTHRGVLYVGVTAHPELRIMAHREHRGSAFTSKYRLTRLVYLERHATMDEAIQREKRLKWWRRRWKIQLIESINPNWEDLSSWLEDC